MAGTAGNSFQVGLIHKSGSWCWAGSLSSSHDLPTSSRLDADLGQCSKRVCPSAQVLILPGLWDAEPKVDRELHRGKNTERQDSLGTIKSNNLPQIEGLPLYKNVNMGKIKYFFESSGKAKKGNYKQFLFLKINLFIFGCAGSSCCTCPFSNCYKRGLLSCCGAWILGWAGFSSHSTWA